MTTDVDLVEVIGHLQTYGPKAQPARHQALLLLWAIGRARQREERLIRWSAACESLRELLRDHGHPENYITPEYSYLLERRTDLWELAGEHGDVPKADGSQVLIWLNDVNPLGGLREDLYERLASDMAERGRVVDAILDRFFDDDEAKSLLRTFALSDPTSGSEEPLKWDLAVNTVLRRSEIHDRFKGSRQSGISPAPAAKSVLLFTSGAGIKSGYHHDGWPSPV